MRVSGLESTPKLMTVADEQQHQSQGAGEARREGSLYASIGSAYAGARPDKKGAGRCNEQDGVVPRSGDDNAILNIEFKSAAATAISS